MMEFNANENTVVDIVDKIESISVFNEGTEKIISKSDEDFLKIKNKIEEVFSLTQLMPAFCVSFHDETKSAMKEGAWLRLNFEENLWKNELPFSALLMKLEKTSGFNLIRLFENKYDGRCLYLALDETVDLKNFVLNY